MIIDPKKLSELIREKKRKMKENPEVVNGSVSEDMNANDVYDLTQKTRIEQTLDSPEKIDASQAMDEMSDHETENVGLSADELKRMTRLKAYFDKLGV